jgi:capsid protein
MCGVNVSTKKRGQTSYSADDSIQLLHDDKKELQSYYFVKTDWRFNQGRGVSAQSVILGTMTDIYEVQGAEVMSAKRAASTVAQLLDLNGDAMPAKGQAEIEAQRASDVPLAVREAIGQPQDAQEEVVRQEIDVSAFTEATHNDGSKGGGVIDDLPPGTKWDVLPIKRPNPNVVPFTQELQIQCGYGVGVSKIFATGQATASYVAYQGERATSLRTFERMQKHLERGLLTQLAAWAINWGMDNGLITETPPDDWLDALAWDWPTLPVVNPNDEQRAVALGFQNGTTTLLEQDGPLWRDKQEQRAIEQEYCEARNLPYAGAYNANGMPMEPQTQDGGNAATITEEPK